MTALRLEETSRAEAILEALLGGDPSGHWMRQRIALQARELRDLDVETRRSLPTHVLNTRPDPGSGNGGSDAAQSPASISSYFTPSQYLHGFRTALERQAAEDACLWLVLGIENTPITDKNFLKLAEALSDQALQSSQVAATARPSLNGLIGQEWWTSRDLALLHRRILESYEPPPAEADNLRPPILKRPDPEGRLDLAIRFREIDQRAGLSRSNPLNSIRSLLEGAVEPIDRAALLCRSSQNDAGLSPDQRIAHLEEALLLVAHGDLEIGILGDLWRLLADDPGLHPQLIAKWRTADFSSPHARRCLFPAINHGLQEISKSDPSTARSTAQWLQEVLCEGALRSRLLEIEAELETDSARAAACLELALRSATVFDERQALQSLKRLAEIESGLGNHKSAAERISLWLALSPVPQTYRPLCLDECRTWVELRLRAGDSIESIATDLLALFDGGLAVAAHQVDLLLAVATRSIAEVQGSGALRMVLESIKQDPRGADLEFILLWASYARLDPTLLEEWIAAEEAHEPLCDQRVDQLAVRCFEGGDPEAALTLLRLSLRRSPNEGDRFSCRPSQSLCAHLLARLPWADAGEIELSSALLWRHDPARLGRALTRLAQVNEVERRGAALAALCARPGPGPWCDEGDLLEVALERLLVGEVEWLEYALRRDAARASGAATLLFVTVPPQGFSVSNEMLRRTLVQGLFATDAPEATRLLIELCRHPEVEIRAAAVRAIAGLRDVVDTDVRCPLIEEAAASESMSCRLAALSTMNGSPLHHREVLVLLGGLLDFFPMVRDAAESRLCRLGGARDLRLLVDHLIEHPEICERQAVRTALRSLSGQGLEGFEQMNEVERRRALLELAGVER